MQVERFVSEGIAHFSYFIGSGRAAAIVDPRRDCTIYLDHAAAQGMKITMIFETHRNEDYAIGSRDLSRICGAPVYHGDALPFAYGTPVHDGDRFALGDLIVTIRETPGHTSESISIVVSSSANPKQPSFVFTGDLLFAGDTGRTDLGEPGTEKKMAGAMYDSIFEKILSLGDGTIICPGHGAGSICGSAIQDRPLTTVSYERLTNPFLALKRPVFIARKVSEHHYFPPYFRTMEQFNKEGWPEPNFDQHLDPISPAELSGLLGTEMQIIDIRSPASFAGGHIPGSLSIWREGLPAFIGWFVKYDKPIILVDDFNYDLDSVHRHFIRLGYDNVAGYLAGGFVAWSQMSGQVAHFRICLVEEAFHLLSDDTCFFLDVRDIKNRNKDGYIEGSHPVYVGELPQHLSEIPKNRPILVYCDAGYKSSIASSVLLRNGFTQVTNLLGGFTAWKSAGYPVKNDESAVAER
jgi:hydroxyacylglutathione hydrolase